MLCPIRYHFAGAGLDGSWAVALNFFHLQGLVFGKEVGFTYGPLGYLILPMPFGPNLAQGLALQATMWAFFVALMAWLVFLRNIPLYRVAIFTICAIFGADILWEFGYAGPDFFLALLVLLLMGVSSSERRWLGWYFIAACLAALLMFIKFSTGIGAIASLLLLPLGLLLSDRARAWRAAILAVTLPPALFAAGYLFYQPSLDSLLRYVRAAQDISSSYNTSMSLPGGTRELAAAIVMLAAYGLLLAALLWTRQRSFSLALAASASLFLEFKHSFVRQPGHAEILFTFLPLVLALVLLFTDFSIRPRWLIPAALIVLVGAWYFQESGRVSFAHLRYSRFGLRNALDAAKALDYPALRRALDDASRANLSPDKLPAELLERITTKSVGIFPWESSYAAANALHYRPFPVFQTYTAAAPSLDRWNADFLDNDARAPEFLLLDWSSIDGRHPLLDVPATALAIFRRYQLDSSWGARLLLRKRAHALDAASQLLAAQTLAFGRPLRFPPSVHPLFARVYLRLNPAGELLKFFFRIPEVDVLFSSPGARFVLARVPPDVMQDGVPLNFLPASLDDARALFEGDPVQDPFSDLVFLGPGAADFSNSFRAEIYEMPGIALPAKPAPALDLPALRYLGLLDTARVESLNHVSAIEVPETEVMELGGHPAMLSVQGWAFDNFARAPAAAVFLQLDGKLYPASYGGERLDIVALFRSRSLARTGFQWTIPAWKLGPATHELSIKVLSADGKGYYDVGKKNRFRITG